jgi:hypothetical protein
MTENSWILYKESDYLYYEFNEDGLSTKIECRTGIVNKAYLLSLIYFFSYVDPNTNSGNTNAAHQKGVLAAIFELELHQRIFETDWRILPIYRQWG